MSTIRDDDSEAFIRDLENRRRAKLTFRTFSTFYADSQGRIREYGVFFYEAAGVFWFEDFEHETNLFGFRFTPKRRKDEIPYEKYEGSFSPDEVLQIRKVRKQKVKNCVESQGNLDTLPSAGTLTKIFAETVTEIKLKDGRRFYFQFMDNTIENKVKQYSKES